MNINLSTAIKADEQYYLSNTRFICDADHTYIKVEEPISRDRLNVYKVDYKQFAKFIKELIKFSCKLDKVKKSDIIDFQNDSYEIIISMLKKHLVYESATVKSNYLLNSEREDEYDRNHGHWETTSCHGAPSRSWVSDREVDRQIAALQAKRSSGNYNSRSCGSDCH